MLRKAYVGKSRKALKSLSEEIDRLKALPREAGGRIGNEFEEALAEAVRLEQLAYARVEDLAAAGKNSWGRLRAGVDSAIAELDGEIRATYGRVRQTGTG